MGCDRAVFWTRRNLRPFMRSGTTNHSSSVSIYSRGGNDVFHVNFYVARNWFQIPNTFDQLSQDQRQQVVTFNIAPGYQHTFSSHTLLTINPFFRRDDVHYYPSPDISDDTPLTISQTRRLTNFGFKADLAYSEGK